jgi:hypothetical protein
MNILDLIFYRMLFLKISLVNSPRLVLGRATLVAAKEGKICYLAIVPTPLEYIVVIDPLGGNLPCVCGKYSHHKMRDFRV